MCNLQVLDCPELHVPEQDGVEDQALAVNPRPRTLAKRAHHDRLRRAFDDAARTLWLQLASVARAGLEENSIARLEHDLVHPLQALPGQLRRGAASGVVARLAVDVIGRCGQGKLSGEQQQSSD